MRNVILVLLLGFVGSLLGESAQGSKWAALNAQIKRTQHNDFVDRRTIALQLSNLIKQDPHSVYRDGVIITFEDKFKTTLENMAIENELEKALSNADDFLKGARKASQNPESEAAVADAVAAWLEIAYNNYKGLPAVDSSLLSEAERTLEILKNYTSTPNPVAKILQNESYLDQIYNWINDGYLRTIVASAGAFAIAGIVSLWTYHAKRAANPLLEEQRARGGGASAVLNALGDALPGGNGGDYDGGGAANVAQQAARRVGGTWDDFTLALEDSAGGVIPEPDVKSFAEGVVRAAKSRGGINAAKDFAYDFAEQLNIVGPGKKDVIAPLIAMVTVYLLQRRQPAR